jgi:preprotein translocase subunit YajC
MILILVVFYFLLIRPQQKKVKEHQTMVNALRRGDKIVTAGGIIGKIAKVDEAEIIVEIADNVQIKILRSAVQTVISKPEPRDDKDTKTTS